MKGLFVLPTLGAGGAERVTLRLLDRFIASGIDCSLVVMVSSERKLEHLVPNALRVKYLEATRVLFGWLGLLRIVRKIQPDFIFVTHPHISFLLLLSKFMLPWRTALVIRESSIISKNIPHRGWRHWLWKWLYYGLYRFSDAVVCQSRDMAIDAVGGKFIPDKLISIIHNPIDLDVLVHMADVVPVPFERDGRVFLVSAGRFTPDKGFDLLVRAIAQLRDPRVHLFLIGEGRDYGEVVQLANDLNASQHMTFVGYLQNPYPYYKFADFYVMSSRFEGFPNAVLESLALGTPVIATPCQGGINEMILNGVNGYFSEAVTAEALAKAIADAVNGDHIDREVVAASVRTRFSSQRISDQYLSLIRSVVQQRKRRDF